MLKGCHRISFGIGKLDGVLKPSPPLFIGFYGPAGSGKSQLLYTAAVLYSRSCGRVILADFGGTPPAERLAEIARYRYRGLDEDQVLDRILITRISDRDSTQGFIELLQRTTVDRDYLLLLDNPVNVLLWYDSPAALSHLLMVVSQTSTVHGLPAMAAYPVRYDPGTGMEKPAGYDYSWPYLDCFVKLRRKAQGVYSASIHDVEVHFRITSRGVEDI